MKFKIALGILAVAYWAHSQPRTEERIEPYRGSNYSDTWQALIQEPYRTLPNYRLVSGETLKSIGAVAMNATLDNRNDFRPRRIKLVHPNGVCLAGEWEIDRPSDHSGYFAEGSRGLVIARASATQDFVNYEDHRAFGLAVKLFPTQDPREDVYTSNLFSVDNIEGVRRRHITETLMTNDIPNFNFLNLAAVYRLFDRLSFLVNFSTLSKEADTGPEDRNPLFRRTVEVARAGMAREYSSVHGGRRLPTYLSISSEVNEPKWVGFQAEGIRTPSQEHDFRNQILDLVLKNGELKFKILTADQKDRAGRQTWRRIGTITFRDAVASVPCDMDLHFHHPRTDD